MEPGSPYRVFPMDRKIAHDKRHDVCFSPMVGSLSARRHYRLLPSLLSCRLVGVRIISEQTPTGK
jgi:hypothetical protein